MCSLWYVTIKGIVRVFKVCLEVNSFSWCSSQEATALQSSFKILQLYFSSVCSLGSDVILHVYLFSVFSFLFFLPSSGASFIASYGTNCARSSGEFYFVWNKALFCIFCMSFLRLLFKRTICARYMKGPSVPAILWDHLSLQF